MKIRDVEVADVIEEKTTIYRYPYCNKKFLNKNSIYIITCQIIVMVLILNFKN